MLTYAQQSKELANIEQDKLAKRIQEYRTQAELENIRASSNTEPLPSADGTHVVGLNSYKTFEGGMQSATKGEASNLIYENSPAYVIYIVFFPLFIFFFPLILRLVIFFNPWF